MNKIKNIVELPYVKYSEEHFEGFGYRHTEKRFNPFEIVYLYFKNKKPLIVKGDSASIKDYLKTNHSKDNYVAHYTTYMGGKSFSHTDAHLANYKYRVYLMRDYDPSLPRRKLLKVYDKNSSTKIFTKRMRRIPRGWIKELDAFC